MSASSPRTSTLGSNNGSDLLLIKTPQAKGVRTQNSQVATPEAEPVIIDDRNVFLLLGALQMLLGILMTVMGSMTLVHQASLGSLGAGLWGGVLATLTGVLGLITGLRATNHMLVTAYLATNLVSLAVTNLVVVFAVTGLVRDGRRFEDGMTSSVVAGTGLLVVAIAHCIALLASGYRCYLRVCPCSETRLPIRQQTASTSSLSSKDQLIANWLIQHPRQSKNILLVPQAAIHGHFSPIYTLPARPISSQMCHHYSQPRMHRYKDLHNPTYERPKKQVAPVKAKERQMTDEELDNTYTGLDRQIAEDFISSAMSPRQEDNDAW